MSQTLLPGSEGAEEPEDADRAGRPERAEPATRPHAALDAELDAAPEAGEVAAPAADPPHHAQWPEQQPWPQAQWSQAQPWPPSSPPQLQWPQPAPYPAGYPAPYPVGYPAAQQPLIVAQAAVVTAEPPVVTAEAPTPEAKAPKAPAAAAPVWEMTRPRQPLAWRAMKWPIRTALKGVYLTGSAAKRHRAAAAVLLVLLLAAVGSTIVIYQLTHPTTTPGEMVGQQSGAPAQDQTPFTIANAYASSPPLASGVIQWLHAFKTFDGKELWNSMSPDMQSSYSQQGLNPDQMQKSLTQIQQSGESYQEFIYVGGAALPGGYTHSTVDVVIAQGGHQTVNTWYFVADSNGKVATFMNLTPPKS